MTLLPGHGPVRRDAAALAGEYLAHREARLAQVRRAVADGATTAPRWSGWSTPTSTRRCGRPPSFGAAQLDYLAAEAG